MTRIMHLADVHWRGSSRHTEYREVFTRFFEACRERNADHIVIVGDVWHTKCQGFTPESIDALVWFFRGCGDVANTHVMLGNHDLNMQNLSRQDALSPIIDAIDHPQVNLYKSSGVNEIESGVNLCVYSPVDQHAEGKWGSVRPQKDAFNIALFHGSVAGAEADDGWKMEADVTTDFFDGYDITMLGDIHKHQFLTPDKRVAYPGSPIPQNYSETEQKGFLSWDVKSHDEFDVEFVPLHAPHPFVTIDWQGDLESTLEHAYMQPDGARFRVRSDVPIPQVEIKHLHKELKDKKHALDIVYKIDAAFDADVISAGETELLKGDLRDAAAQKRLLSEFFGEDEFSDDEWERIDDLVDHAIDSVVPACDIVRNTSWSIKRFEFDNTFVYGKGNSIDMTRLGGITGVFAPNKSGKSSFVGTMLYGLFNTTDRGSMKNLYVINKNKGHCRARFDLSINGNDYMIERQSVRHENKKRGEEHAVTSLNFAKVSDDGAVLQDLNGSQRSDTDNNIRRLLGSVDDVLSTSIAVQSGPIRIDKFLSEGSTGRWTMLSRFTGVDVFHDLYDFVKKESESIRTRIDSMPDCDWDVEIDTLLMKCQAEQADIEFLERQLDSCRNELASIETELHSIDVDEVVTQADIDELINERDDVDNKRITICESIKRNENERSDIADEKKVRERERDEIDIESIRQSIDSIRSLEVSKNDLEHELKAAESKLDDMKRSIKKLETVPCGDAFPSCRFIKDSHLDKKKIADQTASVEKISGSIDSMQQAIESSSKHDPDASIERYDELTELISQSIMKESKLELANSKLLSEKQSCEQRLERLNEDIEEMGDKVLETGVDEHASMLKSKRRELKSKIKDLDATKLEHAHLKGRLEGEIEKKEEQRDEYADLRTNWRVFDRLMAAWSKKGIPAKVVASQLPIINSEIARILHGVTDFTLELEPSDNSSAMEIFIDDGSSRRVFELASGMERMIGSLAIRVALLNVSSLPKPDFLVIDEGFGPLDETHIEAVGRMLHSLKQWFRHILIITHVEGLKDVVDDVLEIKRDDEKCSRLVFP